MSAHARSTNDDPVVAFRQNFYGRLIRTRRRNVRNAMRDAERIRESLETLLGKVPSDPRTKLWIELAQRLGAPKGQTARMVLVDASRGRVDFDQTMLDAIAASSQDDRAHLARRVYAQIGAWEFAMMKTVEVNYALSWSEGIRHMTMNLQSVAQLFAVRLPSIGTALMLMPPLDADGRSALRGTKAIQSPFLRMDAMVQRIKRAIIKENN
jgi:hypothetical protein